MSIVDGVTMEKAMQALDKVKAEYETDNGRLAIITPDRYEETFANLGNHFVPDEPLCRSFGVHWNKVYENVTLEILKCNISICMISKDTNEIMGIRVSGVMKSCDPPPESVLAELEYEELRDLYAFLMHKDREINFFERFGVDEAVHFFTLSVNAKYRRMGLGDKLLAAAVALSRELGFKAIKGEGTSNFSRRIYEKHGFETLQTMPYDSYMYRGRPISEGTGEHTMTKIYGLRL